MNTDDNAARQLEDIEARAEVLKDQPLNLEEERAMYRQLESVKKDVKKKVDPIVTDAMKVAPFKGLAPDRSIENEAIRNSAFGKLNNGRDAVVSLNKPGFYSQNLSMAGADVGLVSFAEEMIPDEDVAISEELSGATALGEAIIVQDGSHLRLCLADAKGPYLDNNLATVDGIIEMAGNHFKQKMETDFSAEKLGMIADHTSDSRASVRVIDIDTESKTLEYDLYAAKNACVVFDNKGRIKTMRKNAKTELNDGDIVFAANYQLMSALKKHPIQAQTDLTKAGYLEESTEDLPEEIGSGTQDPNLTQMEVAIKSSLVDGRLDRAQLKEKLSHYLENTKGANSYAVVQL